MDILPVTRLMQVVKSNKHEDQQPQKRQQPRKKDVTGTRSIYTPDGQLEEESASRIDLLA